MKVKGKKKDQGKLRWDLLPLASVREVVKVLTFSTTKYPPGNWRKVPKAKRRYFAAMMRHVDAWKSGENIDQESGHPHLAHAVCCLLFLLWFDGFKK